MGQLLDKVLQDLVSYEIIEVIELFEGLFEKNGIDYESWDFSYADSASQMWISLMECYFSSIILDRGFEYIDLENIEIDYIDGLSYLVDEGDEELLSELKELNSCQPIQIEIIID